MTEIENLVSFAAQYDPAFPPRIVGATKEQIERFQELFPKPLPRLYRGYLERMGQENGGLFNALDGQCNIDGLIAFGSYDAESATAAILCWAHDPPDFFVELGPVEDPRVFYGDSQPEQVASDSFHKFLYQGAYWRFQFSVMPFWSFQVARDRSPRLNAIREFCARMELQFFWFSEPVHFITEGKGFSIVAEQPPDRPCELRIGSQNAKIVREWAETLLREFGFEEIDSKR